MKNGIIRFFTMVMVVLLASCEEAPGPDPSIRPEVRIENIDVLAGHDILNEFNLDLALNANGRNVTDGDGRKLVYNWSFAIPVLTVNDSTIYPDQQDIGLFIEDDATGEWIEVKGKFIPDDPVILRLSLDVKHTAPGDFFEFTGNVVCTAGWVQDVEDTGVFPGTAADTVLSSEIVHIFFGTLTGGMFVPPA